MPTYAQWRTSLDKGKVAKVTWVCGDQRVLVEEVVEDTKKFLEITEFDYVSLSAQTDSTLAIWDSVYQYSLSPDANRLVVVRDAESVSDWSPLDRWFIDSKNIVGTYLLLVSNQHDYPVDPQSKSGDLLPHTELIRAKGKVVKCSMPSDEELFNWIKRNSRFSDMSARYLIGRTDRDLVSIMNICRKSMMFSSDPGQHVISQLTKQISHRGFSDCLLFGDKKAALLELEHLPVEEYTREVSSLYSRLGALSTLWKSVPNFNSSKELVQATGLKAYLVYKYSAIAKNYDPTKVSKCRNVLTIVDDALQRRATDGAMELLVALW